MSSLLLLPRASNDIEHHIQEHFLTYNATLHPVLDGMKIVFACVSICQIH